jgi:hypothetical protein
VLLAKLLLHRRRDTLVNLGRAQRLADGKKRVHPVGGLVDLLQAKPLSSPLLPSLPNIPTHLIELRSPLEVLQPQHKKEDVREGPDGVRVASEHEVREPNVVVDRDVSSGHASEEGFLVEVDPVKHAQSEGVVAEEDVDPEKAKDREVAEVVVEGDGAEFAGRGSRWGRNCQRGSKSGGRDGRTRRLRLSGLRRVGPESWTFG